jgi:DNA primase
VAEKDLLACGLLTENDEGRRYARFRSRIMFPIRDVRGRVIAFGGRLMGDGQGPKYLNSPETTLFNKSGELYGLFEARRALRRIDRLVLVEGYMDVVALAQAGIANAVATLGTATGEPHFRKLYRYTHEVVCCFDGDQAGRQAAWRALESALPVLEEGRRLGFVFLPDGEDPDTLVQARGREDFTNRVTNALPASEYLCRELVRGLDLATIDGRARLAGLATPHIQRVPEGILRALMTARLEELTGYESKRTPAPAPAGPAPRRNRSAVEPVAMRVLRMLRRRPELARRLDEPTRARLTLAATGTLLGEVLDYVLTADGASSAAILGRWAGSPVHGQLVELLERPWILGDAALEPEFADAVSKLLSIGARLERRELLDDVHQDPSREKFARFWQLRRGAAADPGGGGSDEP